MEAYQTGTPKWKIAKPFEEPQYTSMYWGYIGGVGGNRTRVRKSSTTSSTYLVISFNLAS